MDKKTGLYQGEALNQPGQKRTVKPGINAYSCPRPWTARTIRPSEPEGLWMVECPSNVGGKQQLVAYDLTKEDALVVAAAPDLLKAVEELINCLGFWQNAPPVPTRTYSRARAAISKARGES